MASLSVFIALFITGFTLSSAEPSWKKVAVSAGYVGRGEAAVSLCGGNKVCLLGGRGLSPVGILDTEKLSWSNGANPPFEIHHFQALQGPDNCVWVVGAWTGPYPFEKNVDSMLKYCPDTDEWTTGAKIGRPRGSGGAFLYKGAIYLVSGNVGGHNKDAKLVPWFDKYDLETGKWSQLSDVPHPRDHFHAVVVNGKLYVAGGRDSSGDAPDFFEDVESKVDVYDFASGKWDTLNDFDRPRGGTFAVGYGNTVYVMGGEGQGRAWAEVDVLKGTSFVPGEDMPTPRHGAGAAVCNGAIWVAGGVVVLGGGANALDTVAYFDGDTPPVCTTGNTATDAPTTTTTTTEGTTTTTTEATTTATTTEPATTATTTAADAESGTTTTAPATTTTGMSTTFTTTATVTSTTATTEPPTTTSVSPTAPSPTATATITPTPAASPSSTMAVLESSPSPLITVTPLSTLTASPIPTTTPMASPELSPMSSISAMPSFTPTASDDFESIEPLSPTGSASPALESVGPTFTPELIMPEGASPSSEATSSEASPEEDTVNSDSLSSEGSSNPACFPSDAVVELRDGSVKMISDLKIGDEVKVEHPSVYSPVFFFSHRHSHVKAEMINIKTSRDEVSLTVSPGHLIYVNGNLVPASTARVGDKLSVGSIHGKEAVVSSTSRITTRGLHNPHTLHGDIVVNGVVASTFTSTVHPTLARLLLSPFRMMYNTMGPHKVVDRVNHAVLRTLDYTVWSEH